MMRRACRPRELGVEEYECLDTSELKHQGILSGGKFTYDDGEISFTGKYEFNTLKIKEAEWVADQHILLIPHPVHCQPGAIRHYFLCPGCGQRRQRLRLAEGRFLCRQCWGLDYLSQIHSSTPALEWRRDKLVHKLEQYERFSKKTDAIFDELGRLTEAINASWAPVLARLEKSLTSVS